MLLLIRLKTFLLQIRALGNPKAKHTDETPPFFEVSLYERRLISQNYEKEKVLTEKKVILGKN